MKNKTIPVRQEMLQKISFDTTKFTPSKIHQIVLQAFKQLHAIKDRSKRMLVWGELFLSCQKEMSVLHQTHTAESLAKVFSIHVDWVFVQKILFEKDPIQAIYVAFEVQSFSYSVYKAFCKHLAIPLSEFVLTKPQPRVIFPGPEAYVKT